jgi:hypothetical protein
MISTSHGLSLRSLIRHFLPSLSAVTFCRHFLRGLGELNHDGLKAV